MKGKTIPLLIALLLSWPWVSAARQGQTWRAYYIGTIGSELQIQAELEVNGTTVSGSYFYPKFGVPLAVSGTLSSAGKLLLEERDTAKKPTGKWQGTLTASHRQGTGTWTTPDSKKSLPFTLSKVAEYVRTETLQGERLSVATSYPYFLASAAAWQQVNTILQDNLQAQHEQFLQQTQQALRRAAGNVPPPLAQELRYEYKIAYYTPQLISLLATVQERTVDDRLSTGYASLHFQLQDDTAKSLTLTDFFLPGSAYIEILSAHCLSTLHIPSTENLVKRFQASDLQAFAISPKGLTFVLAPYQVGVTGEEAFFVTVPYGVLAKVLKAEGPLDNAKQ